MSSWSNPLVHDRDEKQAGMKFHNALQTSLALTHKVFIQNLMITVKYNKSKIELHTIYAL